MKGEGVEPGAVVFTAALAECRWAGEQRHVEYLRQEMDDRDLQIVPGLLEVRELVSSLPSQPLRDEKLLLLRTRWYSPTPLLIISTISG